jgi:hypothetical protein
VLLLCIMQLLEVAWYTLWDRTCSIMYSNDHDTFHAWHSKHFENWNLCKHYKRVARKQLKQRFLVCKMKDVNFMVAIMMSPCSEYSESHLIFQNVFRKKSTLKTTIILNIIHNIFNLHDTNVVICILLFLLNRADGPNQYLNVR